jgi:ribosomal protein L37AE/L43A
MRIVGSIEKTIVCPNCGKGGLYKVWDPMPQMWYKLCDKCGETIYESGTEPATISAPTITVKEEKEEFLLNLREQVDELGWCIRDVHSEALVSRLKAIFEQLINYIEEH